MDVFQSDLYLEAMFFYFFRLPKHFLIISSFTHEMASHGILRHVAHVRTDVSEESIFCIIKVTRNVELGTYQ
jgi:hypothetical protein